jgi:hypothetical protein
MSLFIDTNDIRSVLIAGQWYEVDGESFDLDSYEYAEGDHMILGGGVCEGVPATGFRFTEAKTKATIHGPLTAIQAVSDKPRKAAKR